MTDAQFKTQKQRILGLIRKWKNNLGLRHWAITPDFHRDEPIGEQRTDGLCCLGTASTRWEYQIATLKFDTNALARFNDSHVETVVVHELCHILVNEMRCWNQSGSMAQSAIDEAVSHEERVVTMLTNAFMWTRLSGESDARRANKMKQNLSAGRGKLKSEVQ